MSPPTRLTAPPACIRTRRGRRWPGYTGSNISASRLPTPDWQVLLAVSAELAAQRARRRAESEPGRARDSYERDDELQQRTGAVYAGLAAANWGGRWLVVDADVDPGRLAAALSPVDRQLGEI